MTDDDILIEFTLEAREILDRLDLDFVRLEQAPEDNKLVGNIFRAMHTLKGSSGFFSFKRLEKVSHAGESLLGKIRDGQLTLDKQKTTVLLNALDSLRSIIEGIEATQTEPTGDDSVLVEQLLHLAAGRSIDTQTPVPTTQEESALPASTNSDYARNATPAQTPSGTLASGSTSKKKVNEQTPRPTQDTQTDADVFLATDASSALSETESSEQIWSVADTDSAKTHEIAAPVKVSIELLDKLMNLVSEMVLARNRLLPFATQSVDHDFLNTVRLIDLLTLELQERMMKTRMQPIAQVWTKFPRLIRDVSNACSKKVTLLQSGEDTELDRTLIDAIRDPLVHIIRNSIDHGIEMPVERLRLGKPETGKVLLHAGHENGMVVIEIIDDGAGVNYELVRQIAVEKNLISQSESRRLNDLQLLEFIFLPGFSTRSEVTNLSGRGVGMDVVKTNVSNIGGSIEILSERGVGTTIRLKIPLTLAIIPALFVRCGNESYAIPQNSILELVRLSQDDQGNGLEDFYGIPVFRLRNQLVPLIFLNQQLGLNEVVPDKHAALNIAVLQSSGIRFGLVVDEVLDMQEVVVKPLGPLLKDVLNFAGATILGNGHVALILNIDGIAVQSGLVAKIQARPLNTSTTQEKSSDQEVSMLLFELEGQPRLAIHLEHVERLEMISPSQIQRNGDRDVIQYGKHIMHLLHLNQYVEGTKKNTPSPDNNAVVPVIVHYIKDIPIGLVVSQVHEIIHVSTHLHIANPPQKGLLGCVSLGDRIINVLDLPEILMMRSLQENSKEYPAVIDMDLIA
jgi:two-component system chemotaxis sensor kinase CheA